MRKTNQGQLVWRDLITSDPERAEAFYTALLGWRVLQRDPGTGSIFRIIEAGGVPIGTIQPPPAAIGNAYWFSYFGTPDSNATVERAAELGATVVMQPGDVPGFGTFGLVTDPQGALFAPITGSQPPIDPDAEVPLGGVTWNELATSNFDAALAFYGELFGYETADFTSPKGRYGVLQRTEDGVTTDIGGLCNANGLVPAPAWIVYFRVADLDASRSQVESLGGINHTGIFNVPSVGRYALAYDPTGALFALHQPE